MAALLTDGKQYCEHDLVGKVPGINSFSAALEAPLKALSAKLVGDADSGLLFAAVPLIERYADARWVIVVRNKQEAFDSYCRHFRREPYVGMRFNLEQVEAAFDVLHNRLSELVTLAEQKVINALIVGYPELEYPSTFLEINSHIDPENVKRRTAAQLFHRHTMFDQLRINPASSKVYLNQDNFAQWMSATERRAC